MSEAERDARHPHRQMTKRQLAPTLEIPPSTPPVAPPGAPPGATATADVHFTGLRGGKFDVRGEHNKIYALLSAPGLALNARFKEATFLLSDQDPRAVAIKRVHGSVLSEAYITVSLPSGNFLNVFYTPSTPFVARAQVIADERLGADSMWLDLKSSPKADFENKVHLAMLQASPVAFNMQDGAWNVTITPGKYRLADGSADDRVDVSVVPLRAAISNPVAPHGIIGQSLHDPMAIEGNVDQYQPDTNGEYTTVAQGEGAIEGTIKDYEVGAPFGHGFRFDRFAATAAAPRDVTLLSGKRLPSAKILGGSAQGDSPNEDFPEEAF